MESASRMGEPFVPESVDIFAGPAFPFGFHVGLAEAQCTHFWLIDSPNGPTSAGSCKLCGEVREFRNSMYSSTWSKGMTKRGDHWEAV